MHFNQIIGICVRDLYALLLKCTGFDSFLLKPDVLYHKTHHRHLIDHREMKTRYMYMLLHIHLQISHMKT